MTIRETEHSIQVQGGCLYGRSWIPESAAPELAPILLLHDSLGCVQLWRAFPAQLASSTARRVIAYDRLGFGRSDTHPGSIGADFVRREAEEVIPKICRDLAVTDFIACGHSVGGGMAVEAAAHLRERCRALITISAQAFVEDRTLEGIRAAQRDLQDPGSFAKLSKYHGSKTQWVVDAWTRTWLSEPFANWSLDSALQRVRCPVLAVHGELDEYGSLEHPRRIAAGRGTAHIFPQTGHVPHRTHIEPLLAVIQRFLASV